MNTCSIHHVADNGLSVTTWVELLWDDDKPFAKKPFRVQTMVEGSNMGHSHHATNQEAKKHADIIHNAYLEANSAKKVCARKGQ